MKQILLSSNRWYSAATEYLIRLAEHLHRSGKGVEIFSHDGSPTLSHARELGIAVNVLPLRQKSLKDLIELLRGLLGLVRQTRDGTFLVLWVLEGPEHTYLALLRYFCRSFRERTVLVRLRLGDRVTRRPVFGEKLVARMTNYLVFPSHVAAERFFETRHEMRQAFTDRTIIQLFCKDFYVEPVFPEYSRRARSHAFFSPKGGFPALVDPESFVWISVARFDPIKGLEDLIRAFSSLECPQNRSELVLLLAGRSENIQANHLVALAQMCLKTQSYTECGKVWTVKNEADKKKIVVVDERILNLLHLLREVDGAVISSLGSEVICRTATEFMQVGLPVVARQVGSLEETLGPIGVYAPSSGSLKEIMSRSMELWNEPRVAQELRVRARERGLQLRLEGFRELEARISFLNFGDF